MNSFDDFHIGGTLNTELRRLHPISACIALYRWLLGKMFNFPSNILKHQMNEHVKGG